MILTNHVGADRSPTWQQASFLAEFKRFSSIRLLDDFWKALQLFRLRKNYQAVVLGGGSGYDLFYLVLQRLWPFQARPVIKIDCLWYRSGPVQHFFKKVLFRWLDGVVDFYVVWCRREIDTYSRAFSLPRHKFRFIPYHTTNVETFDTKDSGYLFSGGNFGRDYKNLIEAVRGLDVPVIIACSNHQAIADIDMPENVRVVAVSHREFMQLMAEARINVVALDDSLLHSGGQQTFLNAMAFGKPVVVTDPAGAKDYIEHGVDGILVPGRDPQQLRSAIEGLLQDPLTAESIGVRARIKARRMDTEHTLAAITGVVQAVMAQTDSDLSPAL